MNRNLILTGFLLITASAVLIAQDPQADATPTPAEAPASNWKKGALFNLSYSQTTLKYWAAGGEDNFALNALAKMFANYKKDKWTWDNDLTMGYGGVQTTSRAWTKTDDRIELNTKVGRQLSEKWYFSYFFTFRTQFVEGFKVPGDTILISTFMAPGYVQTGLGFDYKPVDYFQVNLSPATAKFTFVGNQDLADAGAFGVEPAERDTAGNITKKGENIRTEIGGSITLLFKKEVFKNVSVDTRLFAFSNYLEKPENIDVNWDLLINMKINKWLSASFTSSLIYDHDINIAYDSNGDGLDDSAGPRTQWKTVLGVGLNVALGN
jgi:hypothetical protein